MRFLLFIWQLPQNILGFVLSLFASEKEEYVMYDGSKKIIYYSKYLAGTGVSLGDYIIIDYDIYFKKEGKEADDMKNHEHGHQFQSLYSGPFYLLLFGLPSALRSIYRRTFNKGFEWYHSGYPEKGADRLGKVVRN